MHVLSCLLFHLELAKNVPHGDQQMERIVLYRCGGKWAELMEQRRVWGDRQKKQSK